MHELSIALNIIETACRIASDEGSARVEAIHLRIGELSCVADDALRFSFELAAEGTPAAGARLEITRVPVSIYCAACDSEGEVASIQHLCCPVCGQPSGVIRGGRELEIEAVELEDEHATC